MRGTAVAVFAVIVFVIVFAVFVKGIKRDNFYSFYKVVAFSWVPRGSRICPRPCCFPVFAACICPDNGENGAIVALYGV